ISLATPMLSSLSLHDALPIFGAAPTVDRLVLVAHHADVLMRSGQQPHQLVLHAVGVLILIDHQVDEAPIVRFSGSLVMGQQPHRDRKSTRLNSSDDQSSYAVF